MVNNEAIQTSTERLPLAAKIGMGLGAAAVVATAVWLKVDSEAARHVFEFLGVTPLFDNPVIEPQSGDTVMS